MGKSKAKKLRQGDLQTEEVDMRQIEGGRETGSLRKRDLETEEVELGDWEAGRLGN